MIAAIVMLSMAACVLSAVGALVAAERGQRRCTRVMVASLLVAGAVATVAVLAGGGS